MNFVCKLFAHSVSNLLATLSYFHCNTVVTIDPGLVHYKYQFLMFISSLYKINNNSTHRHLRAVMIEPEMSHVFDPSKKPNE